MRFHFFETVVRSWRYNWRAKPVIKSLRVIWDCCNAQKIEFDQSTRIPQLLRSSLDQGRSEVSGHPNLTDAQHSEAETHRFLRRVGLALCLSQLRNPGSINSCSYRKFTIQRHPCGDNRMQADSVPAPFHLCLGLRQLCFSRGDDAHGAGFVLGDLGQRV